MKLLYSILLCLIISQTITSQEVIQFDEPTKVIGNITDYTFRTYHYKFQNISADTVTVGFNVKSFLINPILKKKKYAPNETGVISLEFYPEKKGVFSESVEVTTNKGTSQRISMTGYISELSKEYLKSKKDNRLSSDKNIVFMIVDATDNEPIPYSKIKIHNIENNETYIANTNDKGVLMDRLPEGRYDVEGMIDGYKKEIKEAQIDPASQLALILMEREDKKEEKAPEIKEEAPTTPDEKYIAPRKNLNIILLLDISKSMESQDRMTSLKKSLSYLVKNYQSEDKLGIITFNDSVEILLPSIKIKDRNKAAMLIDRIQPKGTTDGLIGVNYAFDLLKNNYMDNAINMVLLSTDGKITTKSYEEKIILEKIQEMNTAGYLFSVIGFGSSQYELQKLQKMATIGGGVFINMNSQNESKANFLLDEIYQALLNTRE